MSVVFFSFPLAFTNHTRHRSTYISGQQSINSEGSAFTFVIGPQYNGDILDTDHQGQGPDDQGQRAKEVIMAGFRAKGRGVDVEWGSTDIAINDTNGLVCEPRGREELLDVQKILLIWSSVCTKTEARIKSR